MLEGGGVCVWRKVRLEEGASREGGIQSVIAIEEKVWGGLKGGSRAVWCGVAWRGVAWRSLGWEGTR